MRVMEYPPCRSKGMLQFNDRLARSEIDIVLKARLSQGARALVIHSDDSSMCG